MKEISFQQVPASCSASGPDICPKWQYCNVSSNRCKPCTDCTGEMARKATSDHCHRPLTCSEGRPWKCKDLYIKQPYNNNITSYREGYLGSTVRTRCYVNNQIYNAELECALNRTDLKPSWRGDFTCVTLDRPPHPRETPTTTSLPVTDFNTTTPNNLTGIVIPVLAALCTVVVVVLITIIITASFLLRKYKYKQLPGNKTPDASFPQVVSFTSNTHLPSSAATPTLNENCVWDSNHSRSLQNPFSIPIQESEGPDRRQENGVSSSPLLSLHLPIDGRIPRTPAASINSYEETRPKTIEAEQESLLRSSDAAMDDAYLGVHLIGEDKHRQPDWCGDVIPASQTRQRSGESHRSERGSLILSSDQRDSFLCHRTVPGLQASHCSVTGLRAFERTPVKTSRSHKPTEHIWPETMSSVANSLSQSSVISLSIGSSSDSDIVLHDVKAPVTSLPDVDSTRAKTADDLPDISTVSECSADVPNTGGQLRDDGAPNEFCSDSLLMRTSPSFSVLDEQTHSLTRTASEHQESEDSGINSRKRSP